MAEDDEPRLRVRRGSEHVRIKGTTEELGEIVPPPVTVPGRGDDVPEGAERVTLDDGEEI
jgi:hypothetical protein